jgi:hypothetical protein
MKITIEAQPEIIHILESKLNSDTREINNTLTQVYGYDAVSAEKAIKNITYTTEE